MSNLYDKHFGSNGEVKVDLVSGKLVLTAADNEGAVEGSVSMTIHSDVIIDLLVAKLGGSSYLVAAGSFLKSLIATLP